MMVASEAWGDDQRWLNLALEAVEREVQRVSQDPGVRDEVRGTALLRVVRWWEDPARREAFLAAPDVEPRFLGYVKTIVRNAHRDHLRGLARARTADVDPETLADPTTAGGEGLGDRGRVMEALVDLIQWRESAPETAEQHLWELIDLTVGERSMADVVAVSRVDDPALFVKERDRVGRAHRRLRERLEEAAVEASWLGDDLRDLVQKFLAGLVRRVRSGGGSTSEAGQEGTVNDPCWPGGEHPLPPRGEGFVAEDLLSRFETEGYLPPHIIAGVEVTRAYHDAVWAVPRRVAGDLGHRVSSEPEVVLIDARREPVVIALPGGGELVFDANVRWLPPVAGVVAPVVDLPSLWGTASVWPAAVRAQVARWAQSDEPLDRAAAVGLAVRGGAPRSPQPADLLAYLRGGPGGWSTAWAAALAPDHAQALVRRALWCVDALAEWIDVADADDAPVPADWPRIVEERERLACAATALVGRAEGALRRALDELDEDVVGRWGGAPSATVPKWMHDVADAQGVGAWWLPRR